MDTNKSKEYWWDENTKETLLHKSDKANVEEIAEKEFTVDRAIEQGGIRNTATFLKSTFRAPPGQGILMRSFITKITWFSKPAGIRRHVIRCSKLSSIAWQLQHNPNKWLLVPFKSRYSQQQSLSSWYFSSYLGHILKLYRDKEHSTTYTCC